MPSLADCSAVLSRVGRDGCCGIWKLICNTLLPLTIVTALIWAAARVSWANGVTDDSFLALRACLLAFFIWRAGSFHELASIHATSLKITEAAPLAIHKECAITS